MVEFGGPDSDTRPFIVAPLDLGGVALIVTTLFMSWAVLCFLIRLYTRLSNSTSLTGADDILCGLATVCLLTQYMHVARLIVFVCSSPASYKQS